MTIAVVNASSMICPAISATAVSSPTFTSSTGNLMVAVGVEDTELGEGATPWADGGTNTWTVPSARSTGYTVDPTILTLAYSKNITGKAGEAVTYTIGNPQYPCVCLIEASGCDTTSPNDVATVYAVSDSVTSINSPNITPAAGDHLLVVVGSGGNATGSQSVTNNGTGAATWTTIKADSPAGQPALMAYAIVTANGTNTYGVTYQNSGGSANGAGVGIAAFKAAAGGPTTAWRSTNLRFRLQSPSTWRATALRFALSAAGTWRNTGLRFSLSAPGSANWRATLVRFRNISPLVIRDSFLRFRLVNPVTYRATAMRLLVQSVAVYRNTAFRFKLLAPHDTYLRFRLISSGWHDTPSRFRLQAVIKWHDTGFRFALKPTGTTNWHDTAARFRLLSVTTFHDSASRFRLLSVTTYRDSFLRFRLIASPWRDTAARFRLISAGWRASFVRFNIGVARDTVARFRVISLTPIYHATLARFGLTSVGPPSPGTASSNYLDWPELVVTSNDAPTRPPTGIAIGGA